MSHNADGSVTLMIRHLREGDGEQVRTLWGRYFERLAALASPILRSGPPGARGTEEDAALSAINAFCDGIARGKFPYVEGREVLWKTLAIITERKALQSVRRFKREVSAEGQLTLIEATNEYEKVVKSTVFELIERLDNPLWREAAYLHLDGYTVPEIAGKLSRSRECIYVWFRAVRKIWEESMGED